MNRRTLLGAAAALPFVPTPARDECARPTCPNIFHSFVDFRDEAESQFEAIEQQQGEQPERWIVTFFVWFRAEPTANWVGYGIDFVLPTVYSPTKFPHPWRPEERELEPAFKGLVNWHLSMMVYADSKGWEVTFEDPN